MIKVKITKSSDWKWSEVKEFSNEKEMLDYGDSLADTSGEVIITQSEVTYSMDAPPNGKQHIKDFDYEMEIYDDYRE